MSIAFHPLRVTSRHADADALIVGFDVPDALRETFAYTPGQYLTLRAIVGGEDLRRSYSICSAPNERLRVGIRLLPGGAFSGWAAQSLQVGQTLDVLPPQGRFFVPIDEAAQRHVLFIAAGSGITPMLSLIKAMLAREPHTRCTLIYGNRRLASTMFRDELDDLKNRHLARLAIHHVFSRESQDAALFNGRLDAQRIETFLRTLVPAATVDEAFVCGPAGMIDDAVVALQAAGVEAEHVHVERFGDAHPGLAATAHRIEPRDTDHAQVSLVIDGFARDVEFRLSDASILDAVRRSGLDVPYACKAGVCSTCKGKLLEGEVRMDRNFALTPAEVSQGFVLCCQAHPLTARVVITLDQR
ncbi:MAG: phenylacetic acid degradation protein [Methylibium sp. NZG]|nr:MAG: phenylacetic acid degradation protein [Methylibium sp. NZG]